MSIQQLVPSKDEMWKSISGYEGMHEISSFGRIRSLKRKHVVKDKMLSAYDNNYGYLVVNLTHPHKKRFAFSVHRLVAIAFLPNPLNKPCVNHKDGNKINNNISNLEWVTYSENSKHAFNTGLSRSICTARLKGLDVWSKKIIMDGIKEYSSITEAAKDNNIKIRTLSMALSRGYKSGGHSWKYV